MIFDTISVNTHKPYKVVIGENLCENISDLIPSFLQPESIVIISDDNVFSLYGNNVFNCLCNLGYRVFKFIFPHGESKKNFETYKDILNFLSANNITRQDIIIALGGGVVGDMAGFAAATFKRGINYISMPTSLIAMVDSSVGGKTGINLSGGKNLVGSFFQPILVLCDVKTLNTLPDIEIKNGYGELIKYGILRGKPLINKLNDNLIYLQKIVSECINIKKVYVEKDEFENDSRVMLNLGHSLGHAIEVCSDYSIPHGIAVANGIMLITQVAYYYGICDKDTKDSIKDILLKYDLILDLNYSLEKLVSILINDKKITSGIFRFILPAKIGRCEVYPVPIDNLFNWINTGLGGSGNPMDVI